MINKTIFAVLFLISSLNVACGQINLQKAASAGIKTAQAATLTDAQVETYVKEYVDWMDANNPVCEGDDPYAVRLTEITEGLDTEGINIKAYRVVEANAFACADGSVRVFAGLMDIMSDEELQGIIGHEIGHVKNKDTKDAFKRALMTSALRDGVSSVGGTVGTLTDSQFGDLGEALSKSTFSQQQERDADLFGYNYLKEHGINPWAMSLSFEKLSEMMQDGGVEKSSAIQQLFSTHPDIQARTRRMAEMAIADGFERPE